MKIVETHPIRTFLTGRKGEVKIYDCAHITLDSDEQVTFLAEGGAEYDVVRKSWGFYATPSTNSRLVGFGLKAVLVRSHEARIYVFLVQDGRESDFQEYCALEGHNQLLWLDGKTEDLSFLDQWQWRETRMSPVDSCICGSPALKEIHVFLEKPPAEISFALTSGVKYHRRLLQCSSCRHVISVHKMDDAFLYAGDYVSSNYGDTGLKHSFDRINALPPEKSDNVSRVSNLARVAGQWFIKNNRPPDFIPSVLDIGSGLCVFLHRIKQKYGWRCTALDPDPRSCEHAKNVVEIDVMQGDLLTLRPDRTFDVVTLNKVIEHSKVPIQMLVRARDYLGPGGLIYIEVPDAECALEETPDREEFTIDHPHVFSAASLSICIERAGLKLISMERLKEASTKYTIRAFAAKG